MKITDDIKYVGVNDHKTDLFEGQFDIPNGMAYNSYVILDEKPAVMDTVDAGFRSEWLKNVKDILGERKPEYLIVSHMEPDHSANIVEFMKSFPEAKIVATAAAFKIMTQFFGTDFAERKVIASEGFEVNLGKHTLKFFMAPMVHWPEVMVSYDLFDKVLFSADAFGKFGANDVEEEWACEARRYYFGIVGKYGDQVQSLLKKLGSLELNAICPLHGPVLNENLSDFVAYYNTWSSYEAETDGVFIAYSSVYGNTKKAALLLSEKLTELNVKHEIDDLARSDFHECIENAFRYKKLVLASTTYNMEVFPVMRNFLNDLVERNFKKRKIAIIENGSWAPAAAKTMKALLTSCADLEYIEPQITIKSSMTSEIESKIEELAKALV